MSSHNSRPRSQSLDSENSVSPKRHHAEVDDDMYIPDQKRTSTSDKHQWTVKSAQEIKKSVEDLFTKFEDAHSNLSDSVRKLRYKDTMNSTKASLEDATSPVVLALVGPGNTGKSYMGNTLLWSKEEEQPPIEDFTKNPLKTEGGADPISLLSVHFLYCEDMVRVQVIPVEVPVFEQRVTDYCEDTVKPKMADWSEPIFEYPWVRENSLEIIQAASQILDQFQQSIKVDPIRLSIYKIEFYVPFASLKEYSIIDVPGLSDPDPFRRDAAIEVAKEANILLLTCSGRFLSSSELDDIEPLLIKKPTPQLLLLYNDAKINNYDWFKELDIRKKVANWKEKLKSFFKGCQANSTEVCTSIDGERRICLFEDLCEHGDVAAFYGPLQYQKYPHLKATITDIWNKIDYMAAWKAHLDLQPAIMRLDHVCYDLKVFLHVQWRMQKAKVNVAVVSQLGTLYEEAKKNLWDIILKKTFQLEEYKEEIVPYIQSLPDCVTIHKWRKSAYPIITESIINVKLVDMLIATAKEEHIDMALNYLYIVLKLILFPDDASRILNIKNLAVITAGDVETLLEHWKEHLESMKEAYGYRNSKAPIKNIYKSKNLTEKEREDMFDTYFKSHATAMQLLSTFISTFNLQPVVDFLWNQFKSKLNKEFQKNNIENKVNESIMHACNMLYKSKSNKVRLISTHIARGQQFLDLNDFQPTQIAKNIHESLLKDISKVRHAIRRIDLKADLPSKPRKTSSDVKLFTLEPVIYQIIPKKNDTNLTEKVKRNIARQEKRLKKLPVASQHPDYNWNSVPYCLKTESTTNKIIKFERGSQDKYLTITTYSAWKEDLLSCTDIYPIAISTKGSVNTARISFEDSMENKHHYVYVFVEPHELQAYMSKFSSKNIVWVTIPDKDRSPGYAQSLIVYFFSEIAHKEGVILDYFWNLDDNIVDFNVFDEEDLEFAPSTMYLALNFCQKVLQKEINARDPRTKDLSDADSPLYIFLTETAKDKYCMDSKKRSWGLWIYDNRKELMANADKNSVPKELLNFIPKSKQESFKQEFLKEMYEAKVSKTKAIAQVSVAPHTIKTNYNTCKIDSDTNAVGHYRVSDDRYGCVLNYIPAIRGFNYISDYEILLHMKEVERQIAENKKTGGNSKLQANKEFIKKLATAGSGGLHVFKYDVVTGKKGNTSRKTKKTPEKKKISKEFLVGSSQKITSSKSNPSKLEQIAKELQQYRLRLEKLTGEYALGNCQFAAVSVGLTGTPEFHQIYRNLAVSWLIENRFTTIEGEVLEKFKEADCDWETMCEELRNVDTWGNHLTLVALASELAINIDVISTDNPPITVSPINKEPTTVITIVHEWEYHYHGATPY